MNDVPNKDILAVPRHARTRIFKAEERERKTGEWSPWDRRPLPLGMPNSVGWVKEIREFVRNTWLVALIRQVETSWGTVQHAAIRTAKGHELGWSEKQRLKNELFGVDAVAVEVYPRQSDVVDAANMYHLWVLPAGFQLPFGLHMGWRQMTSVRHYIFDIDGTIADLTHRVHHLQITPKDWARFFAEVANDAPSRISSG